MSGKGSDLKKFKYIFIAYPGEKGKIAAGDGSRGRRIGEKNIGSSV
jgi:hypothetical protein